MEMGKYVFILAATMAIFCVLGSVTSKPTMDQQQWSNGPQQIMPSMELHPVDNCIFACDHCYKAEVLVKCANECILSEATMGIEWTATCPFLSKQNTHSAVNNPFRH